MLCGARTRNGTWCKRHVVPGRKRCRNHAGLSTGPRTPEGMQRTLAALWAGRDRYLALLRAFGQKRPSGRKAGAGWKTQRMWAKELAAALKLSPEAAARVARALVDTRRIQEADSMLLELVNRTESMLERIQDGQAKTTKAELEKTKAD